MRRNKVDYDANEHITHNFTFGELIRSATAEARGIDNRPTQKAYANLVKLTQDLLQPIRDKWGAPIIITSGYRCEQLNKLVGGASNSQHKSGSSADFQPKGGRLELLRLWNMIIDMLDKGEIECRQLILEYNEWIHISINDKDHSYKKNQILRLP